MRLMRVVLLISASVYLASAGEVAASSAAANDYPTSARAEYVFACMKANGDKREALDQCSCSIDVIASLLPYDAYVSAATSRRWTKRADKSARCSAEPQSRATRSPGCDALRRKAKYAVSDTSRARE